MHIPVISSASSSFTQNIDGMLNISLGNFIAGAAFKIEMPLKSASAFNVAAIGVSSWHIKIYTRNLYEFYRTLQCFYDDTLQLSKTGLAFM